MIGNLYKASSLSLILVLVIQSISLAQELYTVSSPLRFNMREYDDFAAVPYKDGLVFCTNRPQNAFIDRSDSSGKPLIDLYIARKVKGEWERNPSVFAKELNSKYHEGPMAFTPDWKTIYFTLGENTEGIYTSTYSGSSWGAITPFQYNEQGSKTGQPCISKDGSKLFFASNRRGGSGKFDLYVCTLNRNQWSRPKNLGPQVNSAFDDGYPFLHKNGKLYFASNRPGGNGGFDIYFSREVNGSWTKPKLLPQPVNSPKDDMAFVTDSADRSGYLSSDRGNRQRTLDIYEFTFNFPLLDSAKLQETNSYTYLLEEASSMVIDTTTFKYEWDFGDGTKHLGKELEIEHTFPKTGDYLVKLNVIDTLTNTLQENKASFLVEVRDVEQPYITCPDTAVVGREILFDASKTNLPGFTNATYYWDFGDDHYAIGKEARHKFSTPGTYKVVLGVTSATEGSKAPVTEARFREIVIKGTTLP